MRVLFWLLVVLCCAVQAESEEIAVTASFTGLEEHQWFENDGGSTSDGVAPLATFSVLEPEEYSGEVIAILFKYGVLDEAPESLMGGWVYRFAVPGDFFGRGAEIIDDMDVSGFTFLSGGDE